MVVIRRSFPPPTAVNPSPASVSLLVPADITILLLCLQLKQFSLGVTLVLCFSIGLALTMVSVGAAAALGIRHVSRRWSSFAEFARRAPYFSSALIICVGLYTGALGITEILAHGN
jgi:nickel/cobalt transporter (NicO) family protein